MFLERILKPNIYIFYMQWYDAPLIMLGTDQHLHYNRALINVLWISFW